ncbi:MAG: L,D-transpeptidase family protein [Pseudomonadota bacterium]
MSKFFTVFLLSLFLSGCVTTTTQAPDPEGYPPPQAFNSYKVYKKPPPLTVPDSQKADFVLVQKSQNKMFLKRDGRVLRSYSISLGQNPVGPKLERGDLRTPEGRYYLNYKNDDSQFYRSIHISYPNEYDIARAERRGVDPGDAIVIHGLPNDIRDRDIEGYLSPKNWTEGCIAVRNSEMDEIWSMVDLDTPIEIRP